MAKHRHLDEVTAGRTYTVQKGDSPLKIAIENGLSLDEFYRLNPNSRKMIYPNDIVKLTPDTKTKLVNIRKEQEREAKLNFDNISAIQGVRHTDNYVIFDKKNRSLTVFDKDNNPIYTTDQLMYGKSGNDYNTVTYTDKKGKLIDSAGNMSTPAGISMISGITNYHGHVAFTRARIKNGEINKIHPYKVNKDGSYQRDNNGNKILDENTLVPDNIASSFHFGNIGKEPRVSNGCVRIGGKQLEELSNFIGTGTMVYTLPEKGGSRFTLKGGRIHYTADNPSGNDDKDNPKRFWDDYNVAIDKSYSPLQINFKRTGNKMYDDNRRAFAQALVSNKKQFQSDFGLTSDEYNRLADLALGIAEQESKYGTAKSYIVKQSFTTPLITPTHRMLLAGSGIPAIIENVAMPFGRAARQLFRGQMPHNVFVAPSKGLTQIKLRDDNAEMQEIYNKLGIDSRSISSPYNSALATLARLAHMYNNEVKGRKFTGANNIPIDAYDALLYKWNGHNEQLTRHLATPNVNNYINNVRRASRNFDLFERRKYNVY